MLWRVLVAVLVLTIVAFVFKEELFDIALGPAHDNFITYRLLQRAAEMTGTAIDSSFSVQLINTGLARQFMIHMQTAFAAGVICASPYILYQLFMFIVPALYARERRYAVSCAGSGYIMFMVGVAASYFLIFPLTFRFLGTYQVAESVINMISLDSYMSTLAVMSLTLGVVFEMPVVSWVLARLGMIQASALRKVRRHAIVVIVIAAAIITPTSDAFTLLIVALPMWLLYEFSILVVAATRKAPEDAPEEGGMAQTAS